MDERLIEKDLKRKGKAELKKDKKDARQWEKSEEKNNRALKIFASKLKKEEDAWYKQNIQGEKDPSEIYKKCLERSKYIASDSSYSTLRMDDVFSRYNNPYGWYYKQGKFKGAGNTIHLIYFYGNPGPREVYRESLIYHFQLLPKDIINNKKFWLDLSYKVEVLESWLPNQLKEDKKFMEKLKGNVTTENVTV